MLFYTERELQEIREHLTRANSEARAEAKDVYRTRTNLISDYLLSACERLGADLARIAELEKALESARREAFEEAAKVVETYPILADAIRALGKK